MLKRIIEKIKQHRYKILAAVSFVAAGYFFYYSFSDDRSIKMSTFLDALKSEQINEIVVKGDTVYFRSLTSDWYHSVIGNYPLFELFRQIRYPPPNSGTPPTSPSPASPSQARPSCSSPLSCPLPASTYSGRACPPNTARKYTGEKIKPILVRASIVSMGETKLKATSKRLSSL